MNVSLYCLIVLYNKRIVDIKSLEVFNKFINKSLCKLLIFDNSTEKSIVDYNKEYAYEKKIVYRCCYGNIGLPKCYNKAFFEIVPQNAWIMLADDDTFFSEDYLNNVIAKVNEKKNIITGIIKRDDNKLFSPKYSNNLNKPVFIEKPGTYRNIYAVNSGLTLSVNLVRCVGGYDEHLFLDMVDHDFMETLIQKSLNEIVVVDGSVTQNFSGSEKGSFQKLYSRFKIFKRDFSYYSKKHQKQMPNYIFVLVKHFLKILYLSL